MSFHLWSRDVLRRSLVIALGLAVPMLDPLVAFAQQGGGAGPAGGAAAGGAAGTPTVTTVQGPTTATFYPGGVAPVPPGGTLGGGNTQFSSSKPITGDERDTFDFRRGGEGPVSVRGDANGSYVIEGNGGGVRTHAGIVPNTHLVRKGDTLWEICDYYFRNPYQWPRIWSYNPQIQNPHWIYPGDQVRLRQGGGAEPVAAALPPGSPTSSIVDRRRQVPSGTVFLRNVGYIEDDSGDWGEISGAREDKLFLTDFDEVYLRIVGDHDVKIGQDLTVYRPVKSQTSGRIVEIQGTVRVDQWNAKDRIARARVVETLDTIERGARVGPVARRFEVVPPVRNDKDVEATIVASVVPHEVYGQNQVVFIDQGEESGLKPGNRLFVIRKGDGFHGTHPASSAAKRIALEDPSPAATETITRPRDPNALPEEVVAELRVVSVKKKTATALVTASRREIERGDKAYARKGY